MINIANLTQSKIQESSFTELFSLLTQYETLPDGRFSLAYDKENIKFIQQHILSSLDVLLRGLQEVGFLLGVVAQEKPEIIKQLISLGFFISSLGNLMEALNSLRLDADHSLAQ